MSRLVLTDDETELVRAVEAGRVFGLENNVAAVVRADAIRRIVLGLPVWREGEDDPVVVPLQSGGVRMDHVKIEGCLTLEDAKAADGGFLPPLSLTRCRLDSVVSLSRARFHHLSLAGSRLSHLRAIGLNIAGLLDLSALSTCEPAGATSGAEGKGQCWVELRHAKIDGGLIAPHADLVAPARRPGIFPGMRRAEYALDLRAATIGGELMLSPMFRALGGLNIRSAHIDRDLILTGATLTEVEGYALLAAGAKIGGAALFNVWTMDDKPTPFTARGPVTFLDAIVEGSVELRGASVQSFFANNVRIGGAALLGTWESADTVFPFESRKDGVSFDAANISGSLDMSGAKVSALTAQNAYIGGAALLRVFDGKRTSWRCVIANALSLAGAKIIGNLDLNGSRLGTVNLQNAEIGGSMDFETWWGRDRVLPFIASGEINLAGAKITGSVNARGASIRGFNANNAHIGGAVFFRVWHLGDAVVPFAAQGELSLMGCKIAGNLEMTGASVSTLMAINAEIGGGAFLLAWKDGRVSHRFEARGGVFLDGSKIGGNLEMPGATIFALNAQNIDIGGSALLRAWNGNDSIVPFSAVERVYLARAKIRADLDVSGAKLGDKICAESSEIGGNVWLIPWVDTGRSAEQQFRTSGSIQLSGCQIKGSLFVKSIDVCLKSAEPVVVDLSHSSVEVLDDDDGAAWGDNVVMLLEGFRYARLAIKRLSDTAGSRKRKTATPGRQPTASVARLRWLDLQYRTPDRRPNINDFNPDTYDRLARAFRGTGYFVDARAITQEKLRIERRISETKAAGLALAVYAVLFDSGLSPRRAIATFTAFVVVGWIATSIADRGWGLLHLKPVLMLETNTVSSMVVPSGDTVARMTPGLLIGAPKTAVVDELPCGDEIEPLLYALDIFVPALELHQESRCRITTRSPGWPWRIARAIYAVVGWIVTALAVLTISGVARRHQEN